MGLQPVERSSAVELCTEALRGAVLRGEYAKGTRLPPERRLATTLGVNRVTVRGALARLVNEGLLSVRQGSGYEVKDLLESGGISLISPLAEQLGRKNVVRDLLEVRRAIAGVVLQRLAENKPSKGALAEIEKAIDALEGAIPGAPVEVIAEADLAVLGEVVNATGSAALRLVLNPVSEVLLSLPGLQAAMYRSPEQNVLGWRALVAWLSSSDRQVEPLLEVLADRDAATLRRTT